MTCEMLERPLHSTEERGCPFSLSLFLSRIQFCHYTAFLTSTHTSSLHLPPCSVNHLTLHVQGAGILQVPFPRPSYQQASAEFPPRGGMDRY